MNRNLLTASLLVFILSSVTAQVYDFTSFAGLQSTGTIPQDFTKLSSIKFNEDKEAAGESDSKREKKDKEEFLLESNFLMDNILHSGHVVFGDQVTNYLNEIKDELLKDDPVNRQLIRIYTLRSADVNAFTANNGIVLVTTGLIARAESEAELAFILCHEFTHFIKKHAITSYVETKKMERGVGVYQTLDPESVSMEKFTYSRDLETEADLLGFELYKNSSFSRLAIDRVFDILLYADQPYKEVSFSKTYFDQGNYILPSAYFLDTLTAITAEVDYDDSEHTHPNIKKRKDAILSKLNELKENNADLFVQPEERFQFIRKTCRYDLCETFLNQIQFQDAIYHAYLLLQDDSAAIFPRTIIAKALYGLSIYDNQNVQQPWTRWYGQIEGESQQVFYLFDQIKDMDLNVLALHYAWGVHQTEPGNHNIKEICNHLALQLKEINQKNVEDFYNNENNLPDSLNTLVIKSDAVLLPKKEIDSIFNSRIHITSIGDSLRTVQAHKLKLSTSIKTKTSTWTLPDLDLTDPYWKYAFVEAFKNEEFVSMLKNPVSDLGTGNDDPLTNNPYRKKKYQLGIDSIVVVQPVYFKIDERKENPVRYEAAEKSRVDLKTKMNEFGGLLDLDVQYLDHNFLDTTEASKFNDLSVLTRWISEELSHQDKNIKMLNSEQEAFQALAEKYGTDHFAWFGIVGFIEPEEDISTKLLTCIIWPLIPIIVADLATPDYATFFFALVVNAKTGNFEMQYLGDTNLTDSKAVQTSNLYYIMQQIKTEPKK